MAENKFRRYLWLLSVVRSFGPITFDDINYYWHRSVLNEDGADLPKKTFFNHCQAISDIFNVDIVCDRKNGFKYHLDESLQSDQWQSAFLNDLVIRESIIEDPSVRDKILDLDIKIEPRIPLFVSLIKDKAAIRFHYHADMTPLREENGTDDPEDIEMDFSPFFPLGLIQVEKCWFVIGLFARKDGWRRYSVFQVEHITSVTIIQGKTIPDYPESFSPKEYLENFEYPKDIWYDDLDLLLFRMDYEFQDKKIPWLNTTVK